MSYIGASIRPFRHRNTASVVFSLYPYPPFSSSVTSRPLYDDHYDRVFPYSYGSVRSGNACNQFVGAQKWRSRTFPLTLTTGVNLTLNSSLEILLHTYLLTYLRHSSWKRGGLIIMKYNKCEQITEPNYCLQSSPSVIQESSSVGSNSPRCSFDWGPSSGPGLV